MTDIDALIARLRADAVTHREQGWDGDGEWDLLLADALETAQAENKERGEIIENHRAARKSLEAALQQAQRERDALRHWVDNNMTFYNVDADWPVEGHNIPVLAQVSSRIWYHATDDEQSYPFSAVIDAAIAQEKK